MTRNWIMIATSMALVAGTAGCLGAAEPADQLEAVGETAQAWENLAPLPGSAYVNAGNIDYALTTTQYTGYGPAYYDIMNGTGTNLALTTVSTPFLSITTPTYGAMYSFSGRMCASNYYAGSTACTPWNQPSSLWYTQPGTTWFNPITSPAMLTSAYGAGYYQPTSYQTIGAASLPINACSASYAGYMYPGSWYNGSCQTVVNNDVYALTDGAQVYYGATGLNAAWVTSATVPTTALYGGYAPYQAATAAAIPYCGSTYNNGYYVGGVTGSTCAFAYGNTPVYSSSFQYLSLY